MFFPINHSKNAPADDAARDARTASLLRRWLGGRKLSDEEKIEVAQRAGLPLATLLAGPSAPGAKEAVQRAQTTRKHAKYGQKLSEYAPIFGQTDRTVKRWIRRGKELGDLPPLDTPERMAAWWRRCMDHQVPDKLLGFLQSAVPDPHAGTAEAGSPAGSGEGGRDFSQVKSLGIRENVEALRQTHAINKHLLDEALQGQTPNDSLTQLRQKNFERSFELLRKGEQTLVDLEKQRGGLIDRELVAGEIAQLLESLRMMRETMPRRILIELEKLQPRRLQRVFRALETSLLPAVEKARTDEENIFRNLEALEGPEDVERLLAA